MEYVYGHCEAGWENVADAFRHGIATTRDVGASIGVYHQGNEVVNLWGGLADPKQHVPWTCETVTPLASTSKCLATTALLVLVDRGLIDLDAPVATYWPEFASHGKDKILVRQVLSHSSGLAALDAPVSNDDAAALHPVLKRIEQQKVWWQPGTRHGYHAVTFGFIVSGIILKVTGLSVGKFFAQEIAQPLGLKLYLGLPPEKHDVVAHMIGPTNWAAIRSMLSPVWLKYVLALARRSSVSYCATFGGSSVSFDDIGELRRYEVEDASAGGLGNGSSLARMFAALIGEVDGRRLLSQALMDQARLPHASGFDEVLRMRSDWGLGYALPGGPNWPDLGWPGLFGHTGASGSLAFADPEHQLAFGYTPNKWAELGGWSMAPQFRFQSLTAAVYKSLGI